MTCHCPSRQKYGIVTDLYNGNMAKLDILIPSSENPLGWQKFLELAAELIESPIDSRRELPLIHTSITEGLLCPPIEVTPNLIATLVLSGRRDTQTILQQIGKEIGRNPAVGQQVFTRLIQNPKITHTQQQLTHPIRGHVREIGKRSIDGGPWHTVHGEHRIVAPGSDLRFLGLGIDVEEVFNELCEKFDTLIKNSQGLKGKLEALAFMRLVGCVLLHPFWDANGRCFSAHTVLNLQRMSFDIRQPPKMPGDTKDIFYDHGMKLFNIFMQRNNLLLLSQEEDNELCMDGGRYMEYMKKLKAGIQEAIAAGIDKTGPYHGQISDTADVIEAWLKYNECLN